MGALEKQFIKWIFGFRNAFGEFKAFNRSLKCKKFTILEEMEILELIQLKEDDEVVYIIVNRQVTLFATKNIQIAYDVFNDLIKEYTNYTGGI